jgi:hypothetical protein
MSRWISLIRSRLIGRRAVILKRYHIRLVFAYLATGSTCIGPGRRRRFARGRVGEFKRRRRDPPSGFTPELRS